MAYSYNAEIIIDADKVSGAGNHSNFPFLIKATYDGTDDEPDLRSVANGGHVENVDSSATITGSKDAPADLAFYNDASMTTEYDYECQYYNKTTGEVIFWVRIPTLDYNDDTTLYIHYGDSSVTTSQENINAVWGSVFESVWHLQNDGKDSVGNWDMEEQGTPSYVSGKIGNCISMAGGVSGDFLYNDTGGACGVPNIGSPFYYELWCNLDKVNQYQSLLCIGYHPHCFSYALAFSNTGRLATNTRNDAWIASTNAIAKDTWYHNVASFDGSSTVDFLRDGSDNGSKTENSITVVCTDYGAAIGDVPWSPGQQDVDGELDEIRLAFTDLGMDWAKTSYNSQNSPSTFYTMGDEQGGGGATVVPTRMLLGVGV